MMQEQRLAGLSAELRQRAQAIEQALRSNRIDAAEAEATNALAQAPAHPEILRLHGLIALRRGRSEQALQALLQARALRPEDALIYHAMGSAYEAIQDSAHARAALRRACELGPDLAMCWFSYGRRLAADGDSEAAMPALRRAVALAPNHVQARIMLANMLRADGSPDAPAAYRQIIAEHPASAGQAWWGLALVKPMPLDDDDIRTLRALTADPGIGDAHHIPAGFALAVALEAQGDFAGAFAALREAHARARGYETFAATEFTQRVEAVLGAFAAPPSTTFTQGDQVLFIVSMPRSGSTLTEQILASHSQVAAGGELSDLGQLIMDESDRVRAPFPQWVRTHDSAQWQALGQRYLQRTQRWRRERPRNTDKMPGNWLYVGAILAMLPQARIIVVQRDPLETCLACWRYMFNQHAYTHDFADLALVYRQFERATRHWQAAYPEHVRIQRYEDLVAAPEAQIRELLEFCKLPFEASCLDFHATQRRIITPSAGQVREPMRRDTARAANYGAWLDPLRAALELPAFAVPKEHS